MAERNRRLDMDLYSLSFEYYDSDQIVPDRGDYDYDYFSDGTGGDFTDEHHCNELWDMVYLSVDEYSAMPKTGKGCWRDLEDFQKKEILDTLLDRMVHERCVERVVWD